MRAVPAIVSLVLPLLPGPLAGQRLLDLPVRTTARADALLPGAAAVFWNPAAVGLTERAEALLVDVRGSEATGLEGLALAGSVPLDARTTLAAGYQHAGVEGITRTTTSPLRDEGADDIDLGEHVFGAALARAVGERLSVGATVRYARASAIAGGDGTVELGAGAVYTTTLPLSPTLAAVAVSDEEGPRWSAGVELAPLVSGEEWDVRPSYGVSGSGRVHGVSHRIAALGAWSDRFTVSGGIAAEPEDGGYSWQPLYGATLRLNRYVIGVLREQLPNDFGAVHSLRLSVVFDRTRT